MTLLKLETMKWDTEVDGVAEDLISTGVPPWEASRQAVAIVRIRRRALTRNLNLANQQKRTLTSDKPARAQKK